MSTLAGKGFLQLFCCLDQSFLDHSAQANVLANEFDDFAASLNVVGEVECFGFDGKDRAKFKAA